jgi:hypothetical protein
MERKKQKVFIDHALGFPVKLINVPMVKIRGAWTPDINYNALEKAVLDALCWKLTRLTGDEIRFIRLHFGMTLQAFAKRFTVTHAAVIKWEKNGGRPTPMNWTTEKDIRLFVLSKLSKDAKQIAELYAALEESRKPKLAAIHLDAQKIAA